VKTPTVQVGELALNHSGAFKIGPFGSSLKKTELVESGIPVAGIENVLPNKFVKGFRRFITSRKFEELSDYEILPDDVLVTTMGTIGRAASAPLDVGRAIFDSHLFRMRVDTRRVFPPYLCYALNSDLVASQLARMARGAIMEGLNTTILRECSIPLPEMSEQQRITGRLEQADRLVLTHRYALELTDTFLPAAFLELFGDPVPNPKGWQKKPLGEICTIRRGASPRPIENFLGGSIPWIKIGDGTKGDRIYITSTEEHVTNDGAAKSVFLKRGTLIFANCGVSCGFARLLKIDGCIHDGWLAFQGFEQALDPIFLLHAINQIPLHLRRLAPEGTQPNLNTGIMNDFPIVVPPLPLQQNLAALVERVERLRAVQREALRQAEHLFASLLQRAFNG
jgi:type I restriction enzyme S subunit